MLDSSHISGNPTNILIIIKLPIEQADKDTVSPSMPTRACKQRRTYNAWMAPRTSLMQHQRKTLRLNTMCTLFLPMLLRFARVSTSQVYAGHEVLSLLALPREAYGLTPQHLPASHIAGQAHAAIINLRVIIAAFLTQPHSQMKVLPN